MAPTLNRNLGLRVTRFTQYASLPRLFMLNTSYLYGISTDWNIKNFTLWWFGTLHDFACHPTVVIVEDTHTTTLSNYSYGTYIRDISLQSLPCGTQTSQVGSKNGSKIGSKIRPIVEGAYCCHCSMEKNNALWLVKKVRFDPFLSFDPFLNLLKLSTAHILGANGSHTRTRTHTRTHTHAHTHNHAHTQMSKSESRTRIW